MTTGNHRDSIRFLQPDPKDDATKRKRANFVPRLPDAAFELLGHIRRFREGVHGYELGRTLAHMPRRTTSPGFGQIYRLLRRLEAAGFLRRRTETVTYRLRYRFTITPLGERRFHQWLSRSPSGGEATVDELAARLQFIDLIPPLAVKHLIERGIALRQRHLDQLRSTRADAASLYTKAVERLTETEIIWLQGLLGLVDERAVGLTDPPTNGSLPGGILAPCASE